MTNDSVHGTIRLPVLIKQFIDHPIFQRLRQIKQLALCEFVYIGATHTRFAHSIGTCHLAYELLNRVRAAHPDRVSVVDVHCICLAALLHDLGHPCFSHLFEGFMKKCGKPDWEHEHASLKLCDAIFADRLCVLAEHQIGERDLVFIKELISPPKKGMLKAMEEGRLHLEWGQLIKGRELKDAWM